MQINAKANKSKANDRVRITEYKNIFSSKDYTGNWSGEYLSLILFSQLILGLITLKI